MPRAWVNVCFTRLATDFYHGVCYNAFVCAPYFRTLLPCTGLVFVNVILQLLSCFTLFLSLFLSLFAHCARRAMGVPWARSLLCLFRQLTAYFYSMCRCSRIPTLQSPADRRLNRSCVYLFCVGLYSAFRKKASLGIYIGVCSKGTGVCAAGRAYRRSHWEAHCNSWSGMCWLCSEVPASVYAFVSQKKERKKERKKEGKKERKNEGGALCLDISFFWETEI